VTQNSRDAAYTYAVSSSGGTTNSNNANGNTGNTTPSTNSSTTPNTAGEYRAGLYPFKRRERLSRGALHRRSLKDFTSTQEIDARAGEM
jgi:hypothetical protein